jgi:hypothetical protein
VQANAAIRLEGSAENYRSNGDISRSQDIHKVGDLKHDSLLSVAKYLLPRPAKSAIQITC